MQRLEDKLDRIAAAVSQFWGGGGGGGGSGGGGGGGGGLPSQEHYSVAGDVSDAEAPRAQTISRR